MASLNESATAETAAGSRTHARNGDDIPPQRKRHGRNRSGEALKRSAAAQDLCLNESATAETAAGGSLSIRPPWAMLRPQRKRHGRNRSGLSHQPRSTAGNGASTKAPRPKPQRVESGGLGNRSAPPQRKRHGRNRSGSDGLRVGRVGEASTKAPRPKPQRVAVGGEQVRLLHGASTKAPRPKPQRGRRRSASVRVAFRLNESATAETAAGAGLSAGSRYPLGRLNESATAETAAGFPRPPACLLSPCLNESATAETAAGQPGQGHLCPPSLPQRKRHGRNRSGRSRRCWRGVAEVASTKAPRPKPQRGVVDNLSELAFAASTKAPRPKPQRGRPTVFR